MENNILDSENADFGAVQRAIGRAVAGRQAAATDEVRRLVDAAFALIRENGDLEPPVAAIVRGAGLSNKAFYRHFRSKHELLVTVLDEGVRTLAAYLDHRMGPAPDGEAAVREWVRGMCAQVLDPAAAAATRPFALARGRLAESFPTEVARSEVQVTRLLRDALDRGRAEGRLPAADPDRDAESLYHLVMGWVEARLLAGDVGETAASDAARLEAFAMAAIVRTGAADGA